MRASLLLVLLLFPSSAVAHSGILYGPEDVRPMGAPRADGTIGYCIPWSAVASFHAGAGARFTDTENRSRFFFDITEGLRCGRSFEGDPRLRGLVLLPRFGYTFDGPGVHLARFGVGVGTGHARASVAYAPHVLVGSSHGRLAFGVRHGMLVSLFSDLVTLEVSHQMLVRASRMEHDIRGVASVNLLVLLYVIAAAS